MLMFDDCILFISFPINQIIPSTWITLFWHWVSSVWVGRALHTIPMQINDWIYHLTDGVAFGTCPLDCALLSSGINVTKFDLMVLMSFVVVWFGWQSAAKVNKPKMQIEQQQTLHISQVKVNRVRYVVRLCLDMPRGGRIESRSVSTTLISNSHVLAIYTFSESINMTENIIAPRGVWFLLNGPQWFLRSGFACVFWVEPSQGEYSRFHFICIYCEPQIMFSDDDDLFGQSYINVFDAGI